MTGQVASSQNASGSFGDDLMLMTVVVQPEAFDRTHFAKPGYRDQAEMLLRALASNGLLLSDPNCRLLKALHDNVEKLDSKHGQQLQIRLTELQKEGRRRLLIADRNACPCSPNLSLFETCRRVQAALEADAHIVDSVTYASQTETATLSKDTIQLDSYISSDFERRRRTIFEEPPPIDEMAPGEFDDCIRRLTRFSKRLRFYDKQIGKASGLGNFLRGISRIISIWKVQSHFPLPTRVVEIYTCVHRTHESTDVAVSRIQNALIKPLVAIAGVPVKLLLKHDAQGITHDRYLETDSTVVSFSKGFDYLAPDNSLERCVVKIENGAIEHLRQYRSLADYTPPGGNGQKTAKTKI